MFNYVLEDMKEEVKESHILQLKCFGYLDQFQIKDATLYF